MLDVLWWIMLVVAILVGLGGYFQSEDDQKQLKEKEKECEDLETQIKSLKELVESLTTSRKKAYEGSVKAAEESYELRTRLDQIVKIANEGPGL